MSGNTDWLLTFSRSTFPVISILWAALWLMVLWHYSYAAIFTWKSQAASFKKAVGQIFDPLVWVFKDFLCFLRLKKRNCGDQIKIIPTENPGNILRVSIALGSLTPITFGFFSAFIPIPHTPSLGRVIFTYFFLFTSILAAMGHLFLAYRQSPGAWRLLVLSSFIWLVAGPIIWYGVVL